MKKILFLSLILGLNAANELNAQFTASKILTWPTLPPNCVYGDVIITGGATYACYTRNVWTIFAGGGGLVSSVFGRTGAVTAESGDYNTNLVSELTNLYFTNARAQAAFSATSPIVLTGGVISCPTCGVSSITYPPAGVPLSTGSAWSTSYSVGTSAGNLVALNGSAQLPAVSAALLTNFPTLNQSTTGNAATATALAASPSICSSGFYTRGISANGTALDCTAASSGAVSSVFTRTGAVTAQTGDYTVSQITGAAPLANPTFTGTVTIPNQLNQNTTGNAATATVATNLSSYPALCGTGLVSGGLSSGNNNCKAPFTLTTTGSSGAATFSSGTLNIPNYAGGSGTVTTSGTPTVNNVALFSASTVIANSGISVSGTTVTFPGAVNIAGSGTSSIQITPVLTSALPTCNSGAKGTEAIVTDATSPTFLGTLSGSGAVVTPVVCNGTNWVTY